MLVIKRRRAHILHPLQPLLDLGPERARVARCLQSVISPAAPASRTPRPHKTQDIGLIAGIAPHRIPTLTCNLSSLSFKVVPAKAVRRIRQVKRMSESLSRVVGKGYIGPILFSGVQPASRQHRTQAACFSCSPPNLLQLQHGDFVDLTRAGRLWDILLREV